MRCDTSAEEVFFFGSGAMDHNEQSRVRKLTQSLRAPPTPKAKGGSQGPAFCFKPAVNRPAVNSYQDADGAVLRKARWESSGEHGQSRSRSPLKRPRVW